MAENILGILFVTSTSRGRNVFRYPPDPLSPYPRLSQPIYPSSTFTARDNIFGDVGRRRLFPESASATDPRKSSAASLPSSARRSTGRLGRPFGESSDGGSYVRSYKDGASRTYLPLWAEEADDDEEDSDGTDDSDEGFYYMGSNRVPLSGKRIEEEIMNPRAKEDDLFRKGDPTHTNTLSNAKANPGDKSPKLLDAGRKNAAMVAGQPNPQGDGGQVKYDASIENQYSYALGYSLDFLSDMLTPPRAACNRKFELCVDELVFIGHPVTINSDGTWDLPKEPVDQPGGRRGGMAEDGERRGRRREAVGQSHLRTVVEGSGSEGTPETELKDPVDASPQGRKRHDTSNASNNANGKVKGSEDECPSLDMFHMVLIIDKPDPKMAPSGGADHIAPSEGYDEIYREICFKWTAAAYALQARDNWVARESWDMAKARERSMAEGVSIEQCCISMYRTNPLERALQDLSYNLFKFRTSPVNPLYTHLPSTITIHLADLPISMVLSPQTGVTDESWAHWGSDNHGYDNDYDAESSISSDSDDRDFCLGGKDKGKEMRVEPWQTLLLIEDKAKERAKEVAAAVVGSGSWTPTRSGFGQDEDRAADGTPGFAGLESRRGSKETQAEEDESNLMKALIEACDVTKPLADIAHTLRFDLDGIVIPLARELVQNKKAVLIDVINQRLRTLVMPTTIVEHSTSLEEYITSFSMSFPSLPSLPAFISQISAAPTPFRDIIPSNPAAASEGDAELDPPSREVYLDSLIWLLKHDLVIQVHTYVRIWARSAVKEIAWKRLWLRRRSRWVASRTGSRHGSGSIRSRTTSSAASTIGEKHEEEDELDLITPKATERNNPIDASVPLPNRAQHGGNSDPNGRTLVTQSPSLANLDASFLDYDPELEMDSDIGEAEGFRSDLDRLESMNFSLDKKEPTREDMPTFEGSFILRPARAVKEEMRWLRVIREGADEVWASKFDLCVQYFDGATGFEEISYRTGLRLREIDWIVKLFKEDVRYLGKGIRRERRLMIRL